MSERKISNETYELVKIFTDVNNSMLRARVLMREKAVSPKSKDWIRRSIYNRLKAIEGDVKFFFRDCPQDLEVMKNDVLNDEVSLQVEGMTNMILALPKGIRDEVELYIQHRHHVYGKK